MDTVGGLASIPSPHLSFFLTEPDYFQESISLTHSHAPQESLTQSASKI